MTRIVAVCMLLASMAVANAGPPAPRKPHTPPCAAAIEKFCANVPMGEGRRVYCLARHKSQLTPACRERVAVLLPAVALGKQQLTKMEAYYAKRHETENLKELKAQVATHSGPHTPNSNKPRP